MVGDGLAVTPIPSKVFMLNKVVFCQYLTMDHFQMTNLFLDQEFLILQLIWAILLTHILYQINFVSKVWKMIYVL